MWYEWKYFLNIQNYNLFGINLMASDKKQKFDIMMTRKNGDGRWEQLFKRKGV